MNILVVPNQQQGFYYRPDSTLIRDLRAYYLPDEVDQIRVSPVLSLRMRKPGKAIAPRFAERYWDSVGFGLLIHPRLKNQEQAYREFVENSLDYTTLIPLKTRPIEGFAETVDVAYHLNGTCFYQTDRLPQQAQWPEIIAQVSNGCSLRIGDLILVALAEAIPVSIGSKLTACWNEDPLFDLEIR